MQQGQLGLRHIQPDCCFRFDFSHNGVIEGKRLGEIEGMCRQAVQQEQQVYAKEVSLEEAQKINGMHTCCVITVLLCKEAGTTTQFGYVSRPVACHMMAAHHCF